jgi:predicted dehydrogenase
VLLQIAESLKGNKKAVIAGVASRERNKAKKFAAAHCPDAKVFTGYEKLAASDEIDLVYIATPNTYHYEHAIMCIKEYKNILVEKPFAMSKAEADSIFFEAKNRGIFVAEAMWTSYQPLHLKALEWIEKGRIGAVKYVSANLGYDIASVPRLNSPVLGGGSYLDLGVYTTNFALSFMGNDIKVSRVFARRVSSGIDRDTSYCLESEDGSILGNFYVTMCADTDKDGVVVGERGKIKFTNINNYRKIAIYSNDDTLLEEVDGDKEFLRGYVYEFESCANAISKGLIQAPEMPWSKTVRIAQINDTIRSMM